MDLMDYKVDDYITLLNKIKCALELPYDYEFDEEFVIKVKNTTEERNKEVEEIRRKEYEKKYKNTTAICSRPPGVPNRKKDEYYNPIPEDVIKKVVELSKILYAKAIFAYDLVKKYLKKYKVTEKQFRFRSGLSRNDFYKLKNETAKLGKIKFFQIAIGIGLTVEDCEALLKCVGYAFDHNEKIDNVVYGCLVFRINDIVNANLALMEAKIPEEKWFKNLYGL